jgi:hypothetical protein
MAHVTGAAPPPADSAHPRRYRLAELRGQEKRSSLSVVLDHYGVDTWELDANRVRAEIEQYIDLET